MANDFNPTFTPSTYTPSISPLKLQGKGTLMSSVSEIGKGAIEAYGAYNKEQVLGELDKKLNELNQEYFDRNPDMINAAERDYAAEHVAIDLDKYGMTQNPTFQTGDQIDARYAQLDSKQLELDDKLKKLTVARQQGALSSFEYDQRSKQITRELVAQNPHLTKELIGRLGQNLGLAGIEERIKRDEALAKSQADAISKYQTQIWDEADKRNIPITYDATGNVDYKSMEMSINLHRANQSAFQLLDQASKSREIVSKEQLNDLIDRNFHYGAVNGTYNNVEDQITKIFMDDKVPYANKVVVAKQAISQAKAFVRTSFAPYMGDSRIQEAAKFFDSRADALESSLENFKSGEDAKKYFGNQKTIMEDQQSIDVLKKFPVKETQFVTGIVRDVGAANLLNYPEGQAFLKNVVKLSEGILKDATPSSENYDKNARTGDSNYDVILKQHFKDIANGKLDNIDTMNKTITNYFKGLNTPEVAGDANAHFTKIENIVKLVKDPLNAKGVEHFDANSKSLILDAVDTYNKQVALGLASEFRAHPEAQVSLTLAGDGTLLSRGGSSDFNTRIVNRINDGLSAYAAVHGVSKKEAAKEFYGTYFNNAFTNPQAPSQSELSNNNPANLLSDNNKTPTSFATTNEGIIASVNKVSGLYNEGNKKTVKDIVTSLYPAESLTTGVSQKDLIAAVSKASGFKPTAKLDLADKVNFSKLMSAIYSVNGHDISFQKVHSIAWPNESENIRSKQEVSIEAQRATASAFEKYKAMRNDKKITEEQFKDIASVLWAHLKEQGNQ